MSTKDDLIAAKAMIDTPEKWRRHGRSVVGPMKDLSDDQYNAAIDELVVAAGLGHKAYLMQHLWSIGHSGTVDLFDRAIAALEATS